MKTKRTISNISYNTLDHFETVVSLLVQRGVIEWCYWVQHQAEDDELKDHIHFVLQPSAQLDTAQLEKQFLEIDPSNRKPLGVTKKWNYTSGEDGMSNWILYCMHHAGYLASKGQYRKHSYGLDEFGSTDHDAFLEDVHRINFMQFARLQAIADAVAVGRPFALLVQDGTVPINLRAQYQQQYDALARMKYDDLTNRKQSHEEDAFVQKVDESYAQIELPEGILPIDDKHDIPF